MQLWHILPYAVFVLYILSKPCQAKVERSFRILASDWICVTRGEHHKIATFT